MHIFIFSHLDDEFGIFYQLEKSLKSKKDTLIFYVTTSSSNHVIHQKRLTETYKSLEALGANRSQIILLGTELLIPDLGVSEKVIKVFNYFDQLLTKNNTKDLVIYTHAYEGGHPDHDALNLILRSLRQKRNYLFKIVVYPLYHGKGMPWILYKVMDPFKKSKGWYSLEIPLQKRLFYIKLLFNYKSQVKTLIGLAPFYIFKILFRGKQNLKIEDNFYGGMPHSGFPLYEKRQMYSQSKFKSYVIDTLHNLNP